MLSHQAERAPLIPHWGIWRSGPRELFGLVRLAKIERLFDTRAMSSKLTYTAIEVETLRRSAAMAPLPTQTAIAALDDLKALHQERAVVIRLLSELGPAWGATRDVLNRLAAAGSPAAPPADGHGRAPSP